MTKTLDRMTKAELLAHIAKQDAELHAARLMLSRAQASQTVSQRPSSPLAARVMESMGERARRYCKATGARSVDRSTLLAWTG